MWTSDDALVAGLASGDRDAASAFVRRFQRRVYGLARTIAADDRRETSQGGASSGPEARRA